MYEDMDTSDIPLVPELEEDTCISMDIMRDFPYDYTLLLENLLDVGHVHFTHHGTISRRDRAPEVLLEVRLGSVRCHGAEKALGFPALKNGIMIEGSQLGWRSR